MAFSAIIRNKVLALRLAPAVNGAYMQVAANSLTFYSFAQFGLGIAVSRNIAAAQTKEERQELLATANGLTLITSCFVFAICMVLTIGHQSSRLFGLGNDPAFPIMLAILVALSIFESWRLTNYALLQGVLDVKGISAERAYGVLAVSILSIPIVWFFGVWGALFQTGFLTIFLALIHANRVRHLGYKPLMIRFDRERSMLLLRFGFSALLTSTSFTMTDTWLRTSLEHNWGLAVVAFYSAGAGISTQVKSIFLSSISNYSIAALSAAKTKEDQSKACADVLAVVLPPATLAIGGAVVVAPFLIHLIFSSKYVAAASIAGVLAIGDYLQSFDYVIGAPMLAQGHLKLWVVIDVMLFVVRLVVGLLLMPTMGIFAIPIASLVAMAIHVAAKFVVYFRVCGLVLPIKHLLRFLIGLGAITAVTAIVFIPGLWPRLTSFGILLAVLVFDMIEFDLVNRLRKILNKNRQTA